MLQIPSSANLEVLPGFKRAKYQYFSDAQEKYPNTFRTIKNIGI